MAKKIQAQVKLQIPAGKATPAPPVGTALGPHGLNLMEFCKAFNAKTSAKELEGMAVPVIITIYNDRSFTFITRTPPAADLLKKAAGVAKGSATPNKDKVGRISARQIEEIARTKVQDMNAAGLESAMKSIRGTARSMGLEIVG